MSCFGDPYLCEKPKNLKYTDYFSPLFGDPSLRSQMFDSSRLRVIFLAPAFIASAFVRENFPPKLIFKFTTPRDSFRRARAQSCRRTLLLVLQVLVVVLQVLVLQVVSRCHC